MNVNLHVLFFILAAIVGLMVVAGISLYSVLRAHERQTKFLDRINHAVEPTSRPSNQIEEELSLTKTLSRSEQLKAKAAGFIGVDLQQAETYPIKWWLVPPIAFAISWGIIFLATHPIGHNFILYAFVLPVLWWVLTKFIFNWFTNKRNAALLEQFPDALSTVVRCVRVGIPMGEALRTVSRDALEPTKAEFTILADKVSIGIPLDVALRELAVRIKMTEYQFFATALTLQARSCGSYPKAGRLKGSWLCADCGGAYQRDDFISATVYCGRSDFCDAKAIYTSFILHKKWKCLFGCSHIIDGDRNGYNPIHDKQCVEIIRCRLRTYLLRL